MRAGFMEKPGKIYYTQSREPMIERDTDVKIQVKAAGICGSEVHAFHGTSIWLWKMQSMPFRPV